MVRLSERFSLKILSCASLILLLSFSIVAISTTAALPSENSPEFVSGQVIVAFKPNANPQDGNGCYEKVSESHGINQI